MIFFSPEDAKMTILLFLSMLLAASLMSHSAHGYIPTSHFVFSKTGTQHGAGAYSIDQEVVFTQGADRFVVQENWLVQDGSEMRVLAKGDGFRLARIFKRSKIYWIDPTGADRAEPAPQDYFMSALNTRNSTELRRIFVNWGVLPYEALRERRAIRDMRDIKNETEPWVRLGRIGGAVQYAYGKPGVGDGTQPPGLWIEQDAFIIRKMRSPSGAEFFGNEYAEYSRNFWYPKSQIYNFNGNQVTVTVNRVVGLTLKGEQLQQFNLESYRGKPDSQTLWPNSGLAPIVQEFYKRFR
ncbi:MAG: hypothetical protein IT289_02920 [Oligoflexia bacterium]|nr:hypothetical protein [Oligoflexia bacterium]